MSSGRFLTCVAARYLDGIAPPLGHPRLLPFDERRHVPRERDEPPVEAPAIRYRYGAQYREQALKAIGIERAAPQPPEEAMVEIVLLV